MVETREAMLQAGVRLYRSVSGDLLKGLTAGAVAREAGYHRQTFYRYWETQADYVGDLILWLLGSERAPAMDGLIVLAGDPDVDLEKITRELVTHDIGRVLDDPEVTMRIGLALMNAINRGTGQGRGEAYYRATTQRLVDACRLLLERCDLEMAPGYDVTDLIRALQAISIGFALQALASTTGRPDVVPVSQRAVTALFEAMTRPVGAA